MIVVEECVDDGSGDTYLLINHCYSPFNTKSCKEIIQLVTPLLTTLDGDPDMAYLLNMQSLQWKRDNKYHADVAIVDNYISTFTSKPSFNLAKTTMRDFIIKNANDDDDMLSKVVATVLTLNKNQVVLAFIMAG